MQLPVDDEHVSIVQTLLSLHRLDTGVWIHAPAAVQVSSVQGLSSSHWFGPGIQTPAVQTSPTVQGSPSEQAAPVNDVYTQPVNGLQLSVVQGLLSLHTTGVPPLHWPWAQAVPVVHTLPSSQAPNVDPQAHVLAHCPEAAIWAHCWVHDPINGAQQAGLIAQTQLWHWLYEHPADECAEQQSLGTLSPVGVLAQPPVAQVSVVQTLLSLHAALFGTCKHPPPVGGQLSVVQAIPSSQLIGPGKHCPAEQIPTGTHGAFGSQVSPVSASWTQPFTGSHESAVHTFPSSHCAAVPPSHIPFAQLLPATTG